MTCQGASLIFQAKQEHLYEVYATEPDRAFWRELAKCSQEEFEKSGTNGKCIEARELMIALPESFINYNHDYLLKKMVDKFKEKYGVECFAALHNNKRKTNLHIHMIFAERKRLEQLTEKAATRNIILILFRHFIRNSKWQGERIRIMRRLVQSMKKPTEKKWRIPRASETGSGKRSR